MKTLGKILFLILLLVPSAALLAKGTSSVEVKHGTVVAVFADQLVVKMANGKTEEITVPAGFMFTVDGKQVGLDDLKPGTDISAVITTTHAPHIVKTTEIKNGEVVKVAGNTVLFRENGVVKSYQVSPKLNLMIDGQKVEVHDLRPGQKLTAEIVYTSESTVTTRDVEVSGRTPAKPAKAATTAKHHAAPAAKTEAASTGSTETAPAGEAAPAAEAGKPAHKHAKLPPTGSSLPLIGLLGALFLVAGLAVRRAARD